MLDRVRKRLNPAVLLCLTASCSTTTGADDGEFSFRDQPAPILTDQLVYTVRRGESRLDDGTLYGRYIEFTMNLKYTNPTDGPIYLPTCHGVHPPVIEKKEDGQWVVAFAPIVPACLGPPVVIPAGDTYEYTYPVQAFLPGSRVYPQFETEVPGNYRLVWCAYRTWTPDGDEPGLGVELPKEAGLSNEFELRE